MNDLIVAIPTIVAIRGVETMGSCGKLVFGVIGSYNFSFRWFGLEILSQCDI